SEGLHADRKHWSLVDDRAHRGKAVRAGFDDDGRRRQRRQIFEPSFRAPVDIPGQVLAWLESGLPDDDWMIDALGADDADHADAQGLVLLPGVERTGGVLGQTAGRRQQLPWGGRGGSTAVSA